MKISDDGAIRSLPDGMFWIDSSNKMLVRECWKKIFSILLNTKNVILKGKAGRGKSIFLLCIVFEILHCAKRNIPSLLCPTAGFFPADPQIVYVDRSGKMFLATLNGLSILNDRPAQMDFYFSDNVDITDAYVGSLLTMAVTSGDEDVLKEYKKRYEGVDSVDRKTLYMPSLELEEMGLLFPELELEELQFKFDVIGGNPRKMKASFGEIDESKFIEPVMRVVRLVFTEEYVPDEAGERTKRQTWGEWAILSVVRELEAASPQTSKTDSSFFMEFHLTNDFQTRVEQYSSRFLRLVAGSLKAAFEESVLETLKALFGSGGIGTSFEFTAHQQLMEGDSVRWCKKSSGEYEQLNFGKRSAFRIHNVKDIQNLPDGTYGLPMICNFPLVDAVLRPNLGLQMTTSDRHKGSVAFLPKILEGLQVEESNFRMVFVVPITVLSTLKLPKDLGAVQIYVTAPDAMSEDAFKACFQKSCLKQREI